MEPVGAAASAFALLSIASQVINGIRTATSAEKDRRRLREQVRSVENILQYLTDKIEDAAEPNSWRRTLDALEAPGGPFSRLQTVLTELLSKLKDEQGAKKIASSVKWPFKEGQVKEAMLAIDREKSLIHLALSNNSRQLLQKIEATSATNQKQLDNLLTLFTEESASNTGRLNGIQSQLGALQSTQATARRDCERLQILDWLSPIDHTGVHSDFVRRREEGSGAWLLESTEYQTWIKGTDKTLFCPGIPGAGKTVIASVVIQDLLKRSQSDPGMAVAYLYCNFNRHAEQGIEDLLGSIVRQLLHAMESVPSSLADLFEKCGGRRKPSLEEIRSSLDAVAQLCGRAFVVVDALDECQQHTRSALLGHIFEAQSNFEIKLFMTSRFLPEITSCFDQTTTLEIRANEADLRRFLESQMSKLPFCVRDSLPLQQEIQRTIIEATRGMFLLARLHVQSLEGKRSARAVKNALEKLPRGTDSYDAAYDAAMHRIGSQLPDQAKLAMQALTWITRAGEELSVDQLRTALSIKPEDQSLDRDDMPDIDDVLSVCCGLVTITTDDGWRGEKVVRLVHYTTQEYFDRTWSRWFPDAETEMGLACVTYLLFSNFRSAAWAIDGDNKAEADRLAQYYGASEIRLKILADICRHNPFYRFAATTWVRHARTLTTLEPKLLEFLSCLEAFDGSYEIHRRGRYKYGRICHPGNLSSGTYIDKITATHLLAVVGLHNILQQMPGHPLDINARDNFGMTPLMHAAYLGHSVMVSYLLEHGADHALQTTGNQTAPSLACMSGHLDVVEVLLQAGFDTLKLLDMNMDSPLVCAVRREHFGIVERLLETGQVNVETGGDAGPPLVMAAKLGQLEICRILLDKGQANINANVNVHVSSYENDPGHLGICDGMTPLIAALNYCQWPIVGLLLGHDDIQVNVQDSCGDSALHIAARKRKVEVVRLLIGLGADVTARNKKDETPLLAAVSYSVNSNHLGHNNYLEVVEALLATKSIEPDARDVLGVSVLSHVVGMILSGIEDAVTVENQIMRRLLATEKVDINSQDNSGRTPLHHAAYLNDVFIFEQLLLLGGIDPTITSFNGQTAFVELPCRNLPHAHDSFSFVVEGKVCTKKVKLLAILSMGFGVSTSNVLSLLEACESEFDDCNASTRPYASDAQYFYFEISCRDLRRIARRFLEMTGTEFDRRRQGLVAVDCPPLVFAYKNRASIHVVREILALGADVNAQDSEGVLTLHRAVADGDSDIVNALLTAGANTESRDHLGRTALGCIGRETSSRAVESLLNHGADVHAKDLRGQTPLVKAVLAGDKEEVVRMLLEAGARVDDTDEEGHDMIWHARKGGRHTEEQRRVIRMLEQSLGRPAGDDSCDSWEDGSSTSSEW